MVERTVRSRASPTNALTPASRRRAARSSERVMALTSCPASISWCTRGRPIAPVAPATKTFTSPLSHEGLVAPRQDEQHDREEDTQAQRPDVACIVGGVEERRQPDM